MMRPALLLTGIFMAFAVQNTFAQTTIFFQGFEGSACNDTWPISGTWERNDQGGVNYNVKRTGTYAARVGRGTGGSGAPGGLSNGPTTLTMSSVNVSGLSGVQVKLYTSTHASSGSGHGSGTGLDTDESATVQFRLNGGAWTTYDQVSGFSNYTYTWGNTTVGSTGGGCSYTMPNPLVYNVPAGTTTIEMRVFSSRPCASGSAGNYDRADEGIYIDDIEITTTSTISAVNWTGASSTDWFCKANWSPAIVPTASMDATVSQTALNNCVVGVAATGTAVCRNLTVSSNNGTNRTLTVQNNTSLTCSGDVAVNKTAGSGSQKITLLNNAVFSCMNLSMTGSGSGAENAQFENEFSTPTATVNGNVTINNGGVLDLTDSPNYGIIHIKGNYTNNGLETDFKQSGSIVHFDGTGAQSITTGGFTEIFANVVVNKSAGLLTLNNSCEVENTVTFTNGIVYTSLADLLIFLDGASASGMSNASHVDGPVRKVGNEAFTFPVGDAGNYQDISISAPSSSSHHFTAQYFQADPDPAYDRLLKDPALDHISACEYWILDRTNGSSNVAVTLRWDASSCGVTVPSDLRVAHWDGSQWQNEGNGGTTGTAATGTVASGSTVSYFSPFTLSSVSTENPLPVSLLSFNAVLHNGVVYTSWATASEQNTQFHIVERSADGFDFSERGQLPAAGNSNNTLHYTWEDHSPLINTSYYRLKTVDMDGAVAYSNTVPVTDKGENTTVLVYTQESALYIKPFSAASVRVYAISGQMLLSQNMEAGQNLVMDQLQNGAYLVQILSGGKQQSVKAIIAK